MISPSTSPTCRALTRTANSETVRGTGNQQRCTPPPPDYSSSRAADIKTAVKPVERFQKKTNSFFIILVCLKLGKFVCYLLIMCVFLLGNLLSAASSDDYHIQEGERQKQHA